MTKDSSTTEYISLADILTRLPGHVYWKDRNGVVLGCNQQQAINLGYSSPEEVIGKTDFDWCSYDEALEVRSNDQWVITTGATITVEEGSYLSHKMPLRNYHGNIVGVLGMSMEISSYKTRLEQAKHRLEEIISALPGHVYWKDRNGVIQGCNELQAQRIGLSSPQDVVGKTIYEFLDSKQPESERLKQAAIIEQNDEQIMLSDLPKVVEEHGVLAGGVEGYFWSNKVPLHDKDGKVDGLVGISIDITPLKQAEDELKQAKEAAESASRAKSEFIANISHDFVTALTSILGLTELLLEKKVDAAEQQHCLTDIHTAGSTLLHLINDIIDFTKLEREVKHMREDVIDLAKLLDNVRTLVANRAAQKELELDIQSDCPQMIISDKNRLTRILMNLAGNAIKFTEKGKVSISVKLSPHANDGTGLIHIVVSDSGIGIPQEKQQFIFERFSRVDPTYQGHESGAGLGLNIVKRLVEDFGGTIDVSSQLGSGTTFTVEIPCRLTGSDAIQHFNAGEEQREIVLRFNARILLVEDNTVIQRVTKRFLEDLGCTVDCAETGEQALQMVSAQHDLILLDIGLPDRDGLQVAQEIRQHKDKKINSLPIVAHTAHLAVEDRQKALTAGMSEFLTKPTNKMVLADTLAQFLKTI